MQASEYFNWLPERDQPQFILTCDFQRWNLIDLDNGRRGTKLSPERLAQVRCGIRFYAGPPSAVLKRKRPLLSKPLN